MRKTPYQMLLEEFRGYANEVSYPTVRSMWTYSKEKLSSGWSLEKLYERVLAAKQLGFDVVLRAEDDGLHVKYVRERPSRPWRV